MTFDPELRLLGRDAILSRHRVEEPRNERGRICDVSDTAYVFSSLETRPSPSSAIIIITLTFEPLTAIGFKGQRNNNNRGGGRRPGFEATFFSSQ